MLGLYGPTLRQKYAPPADNKFEDGPFPLFVCAPLCGLSGPDGASSPLRRALAPAQAAPVGALGACAARRVGGVWLWPQLLLSGENEDWWTVTYALTVYYTGGSNWGALGISMATCVFSLIPIIIIFVITQNKMIDGLASTGVKG